jgi:hypothetical protein
MAIHKSNKLSAHGKSTQAPLKAADSHGSLSSTNSRKSGRVSRPLFKAAESRAHDAAHLPSRPSLKAANSLASLSSTSSPKSLRNVSVGLETESCASSADHISVVSDNEVDPEIELSMCNLLLLRLLLNIFCIRQHQKNLALPCLFVFQVQRIYSVS